MRKKLDAIRQEDHGIIQDVLNAIQDYSKCYPYMDTSSLMNKLAISWENLSSKNMIALKQSKHRLSTLSADPKADPDIVSATEKICHDLSGMFILLRQYIHDIFHSIERFTYA